MGLGSRTASTEHTHELSDAPVTGHFLEMRDRAPRADTFADEVVMVCQGGYLREMGDSNNLVVMPELPHLHANSAGNLAAHISINLVKDEQRRVILLRQSTFESQHNTGHFSAGGNKAQRFEGLARVGTEKELDAFRPRRPRLRKRLKLHFKLRLQK